MNVTDRRLLWLLKILSVAIVVVFWIALQSKQDFWPLTRWRMYATGTYPPTTQSGYEIRVIANNGGEHRLYTGDLFSWEEMGQREDELIGHVLNEGDVFLREDYRLLFVDRLQRALPLDDMAWIEIWQMEWPVYRWEIPSIDRANPLESSLALRVPADYYRNTQPRQSDVSLKFGDSLGLLDHHLVNDTPTHAPCETLYVLTGWRALEAPPQDYQITLVLVGLDGMGIIQNDGPLAVSRSGAWLPGEEYLDRRSLSLPCDLEPGRYRLMLGLYDPDTVQNLPITYPDGPEFSTLALVTEINVDEAEL